MKQSTVKKYTNILTAVKNSGKSLSAFCKENGLSYNSIRSTISTLKKQNDNETEGVQDLIALYNEVTSKAENIAVRDIQDGDDVSETVFNRDDKGRIESYEYRIFRKNKCPLSGRLTREEMNTIHRLYSYYGDSLTQRVVSRHFVDLSLVDFKRILRAFNITKASAPFAPHMIEECSEDELRNIQLREKENSFLRKAEEDLIKNNEKLLRKYAQENIELKKQLKASSEFKISIPDNLEPVIIPNYEPTEQSINLYLSDLHLGAAVTTGALYKENVNYGYEEAKRRLSEVIKRLGVFRGFDTINIILMGDNVDCCGVYGKTGRLDHDMPENMDVREQANKYIELIMWFINSLTIKDNELCSRINVYSVPCGNHGSHFEYMCNKTLLALINAKFPSIHTTMWEEFFGAFEFMGRTFLCTHGKDAQFMKKGMPLNLDDKTKIMIYEWLHDRGMNTSEVHVIKGDLHSDSLNSCKRFTYRNVLSLFGASDYSNYNFSRNSYGVSYDLFIGSNLIRGTFENI